MKKIVTVLGARPQFIKASVVSHAIAQTPGLTEVVVHTGQHFDANMSDVFFAELGMSKPDYFLNIHGGTHGAMTGRMLAEVEKVLLEEKPDVVLVYGDTNSTLAGALAAAKIHIPVAHVEAGLRSFNMAMPEEINRILTDNISKILFCPTETAVKNLHSEGFTKKPVSIAQVGDVMQDAAIHFANRSKMPEIGNVGQGFVLATVHRAENTDNPENILNIANAINKIHQEIAQVILPLHPRTRNLIQKAGIELNVKIIDPVGYLEMIGLLQECGLVLTDSGGLQKEAYFFGKPCVTMREQTEWSELVEMGVNVLVGTDTKIIINEVKENIDRQIADDMSVYGGGKASERIVEKIKSLSL
ncbi:non-hydrolyzing UDP-N-acetylglucosamine 2-epimerase [Ottowia caeni]|uniref:non-hydrolyzing UDP-N-acetylglucosamine 2-epimerase n=1 Tax=Ottowia caeni TaxID=2870339 RepID=UPI003D73CB0B